MFAKIFTFVIIAVHVTAEMPSYIHFCGRKDPNYNQCVAESIINLKDKICTGFPEFDIPATEPLIFDKIVIFDENNIKLYLRNIKQYGFCDFVINSVYTDLERLHFDVDVTFPHLYMNTTYDLNMRVLVPIAHKGLIEVMSSNVTMKIGMDLKVIIRNGKEYIFASKVNTKLDVSLFKYKFLESEREEFVQLQKIIDDIVVNNKKKVLNAINPVIEERISKLIISIFNNIASFYYKELYLEKNMNSLKL